MSEQEYNWECHICHLRIKNLYELDIHLIRHSLERIAESSRYLK